MENNKVTAEILNDLIEINNDRVVGYEKAMNELQDEDADLKALFAKMAAESNQLKSELSREVQSLGEEVASGTTNSGKIYRVWMDVKAAFTGGDRKTVLSNCEFGEDAAQNAYKMALESEDLPARLRDLVQQQKTTLRASHDEVKALRDAQPA